MGEYLQNLFEMILSVRSTKRVTGAAVAQDEEDNDEEDDGTNKVNEVNPLSVKNSKKILSAAERKKAATEDREWKRRQEAVLREVEQSLMKQFDQSLDPFMLNLIFIENSRDYGVNKYNTLSCLIAKSFERWLAIPSNSNLDVIKVKQYFFN